MSIRRLKKRLEKVENRLLPSDEDSCTLEELSRAIWQNDSRKYRKMALEIPGMDLWINQFEREGQGNRNIVGATSSMPRSRLTARLGGLKKANLTRAEISGIYSQFHNHKTFCAESLKIRNLNGLVVPFELYPGPQKLAEAIRRQREQKKPVRIAILKTRRSFFTAGVCAEIIHEVPFSPGLKAMIIADKYKPAGLEAFDYIQQFQRTYRPFARNGIELTLPKLVKDSQEKIEWENGSSVEVFSADTGEVRGAGKHFVLCDEVAFWRNPSRTLAGVLNMVPYLPETTVIIQSTANGIGDEFYDMCQKAQDPSNEGGWEFLFFGWLEHPVYRLPLSPERAAKLQATLSAVEVTLQRTHDATLEQLAWRRKTIAIECRGDAELFNQEYPTTALDAFLSSGRPAFDHQAIQRMPISPGKTGELRNRTRIRKAHRVRNWRTREFYGVESA